MAPSQSSATTCKYFFDHVKGHLDAFSSWFISSHAIPDLENHYLDFLKSVYTNTDDTPGHGESALAAPPFCTVVPTAAPFSQVVAHVVNYYLDEERQVQREDLVKSARLKNKTGGDKVLEYVYAALRADPPQALLSRVAPRDLTLNDGSTVKSGARVFADIIGANINGPANASPVLGLADCGLLSGPFFDAYHEFCTKSYLSPGSLVQGNSTGSPKSSKMHIADVYQCKGQGCSLARLFDNPVLC